MEKPDKIDTGNNVAEENNKEAKPISECNWENYLSLYVTSFSLIPVLQLCLMAPVVLWRMAHAPISVETTYAVLSLSGCGVANLIWIYVWLRRIRPLLKCKGSTFLPQSPVFLMGIFAVVLSFLTAYWHEPIFAIIGGLCRNATMVAVFVGFRFAERYAVYYQYYGKRSKVSFIEWCNLPKRS